MAFESFSPSQKQAFESYLKVTDHLVMVVLNPHLVVVKYNAAFPRIINSPTSLVGRNFLDLLMLASKEDHPFKIAYLEKVQQLIFLSPDNSTCSLDCTIYPVEEGFLMLGGHLMLSRDEIIEKMTLMSNELINMTRELHKKNRDLEEARAQLKVLGGIIPICMYCKEIRNDQGYWNQLEEYITMHSEAFFSHGICPKCAAIHREDDDE